MKGRAREGTLADPNRARLFRDLLLLIVISVGILLGASVWLVDDIKRDLAQAHVQSASTLVRDEVRGLLLPVQQQLLILRDGLRSRELSPLDVEALNTQLMPALMHMDQIAGAAYADASGREYFLRREDGRWITRERAATPDPSVEAAARIAQWADAHRVVRSREETTTHDPRTRPWFTGAEQALATAPGTESEPVVSWSAPYRFFWLDEPGVTVSTAWAGAPQLRVLALDITLARILTAVERFQRDGAGEGFLLSGDGSVFTAADAGQADTGFYNADAHPGGAMVFEAIAAWREAGRPKRTPIDFESGGKQWWGGFVPLEPTAGSAWVGVAFPSTGPLNLVQQRWQLFAATAVAIAALAIGIALLVVRRYGERLRELPKLRIDRADPQSELYDLIGRGESTHLEFKSTMRANLRSGKNDKAIELAWLKGVAAFLNSEGGILLLGVADHGEPVGLGPDAFANDDKTQLHFKNLVNQHLGVEAMRLLQFTLFWLEDKQVGVIECEPSAAPIYLRHGNGESFLIRTGPSNTELSISRAFAYIRSRF